MGSVRHDTSDGDSPAGNGESAPTESGAGAPAAGYAVSDIFSTEEILERIVISAEEEFDKPNRLLFWSGLAAGIIMSLSFLGVASMAAGLPPDHSKLVPSLLYPLGFVFIVVGRYQLFTENTLTPVTLVLTRRASLLRLLHIWGLVFLSNILGAALAGFFYAYTGALSPDISEAARVLSLRSLAYGWWDLFFKGAVAGLLVAGMVWLNHAVREGMARLFIIFFLMYTIGVTEMAHCIVGASEMFFLVFRGEAGLAHVLWAFLTPATLGNTVGGVLLVAILNYARTETIRAEYDVLSWREWLFGWAMKKRTDGHASAS